MKLIRDKLALTPYPGSNPRTVILVNKETQQSLIFDKILEEAFELFHAKSSGGIYEELCDLEQAIDDFKWLHNINEEELVKIRQEKTEQRGSFLKGYALV